MVQDSRREFVISAGGIKSAFPSVESLFAAAPQLPRWHFIRFRPRRTPMDISYAGTSVQAETVLARLSADGAKPDIVLYMPGYSEAASRAFIGIAFLLLDHALGEYDVEMSVGDISVRAIKDAPPGSLRLEQLPFEFDRMLPKQ